MSRLFCWMFLFVVSSFVSGCNEEGNGAQVADGDADWVDTQSEPCRTDCDSRDDCESTLRWSCPSLVGTWTDEICVEGRLYRCMTPEDSPCCEGFHQSFIHVGECDQPTPACTNPFDDPDGDEDLSDGDEIDGDDQLPDGDEEDVDWVAYCAGFGEDDCPESHCMKFYGWDRELNRDLGCFHYVSSYGFIGCAPGSMCEDEGIVAISPGGDCMYLPTCSVPEIEGWVDCNAENPSDSETCRACTTSCDDLTDGDGADPCHNHGSIDPRNGSCICDSENMTEDCSECLDGFGEYPVCDTPLVWTDPDTGLMWMNPAPAWTYYRFDAMFLSQITEWAGYEDWRIPTLDELRSLIRGCPATEPGGACCPNADYPGCHHVNGDCDGCAGGEGPNDGCYWRDEMEGPCSCYWTTFIWGIVPELPDYADGLVVCFGDGKIYHWSFDAWQFNTIGVRVPTTYSKTKARR